MVAKARSLEADWPNTDSQPPSGESISLFYLMLVDEAQDYSGSRAGSAFDLEVRFCVVPQALNDKRAELAFDRPRASFRKANSVVRNDDAIVALVLVKASNYERAASSTIECVLERIGQQFIDDKTNWHRDIDRRRGIIDFDVESNSLDSIGVHNGRGDLAEIMTKINNLPQSIGFEVSVEHLEGFNSPGEPVEIDFVPVALVTRVKTN